LGSPSPSPAYEGYGVPSATRKALSPTKIEMIKFGFPLLTHHNPEAKATVPRVGKIGSGSFFYPFSGPTLKGETLTPRKNIDGSMIPCISYISMYSDQIHKITAIKFTGALILNNFAPDLSRT